MTSDTTQSTIASAWRAATARPTDQGYEYQRALMEGHRNESLSLWTRAALGERSLGEERSFEAGFERGWNRRSMLDLPPVASDEVCEAVVRALVPILSGTWNNDMAYTAIRHALGALAVSEAEAAQVPESLEDALAGYRGAVLLGEDCKWNTVISCEHLGLLIEAYDAQQAPPVAVSQAEDDALQDTLGLPRINRAPEDEALPAHAVQVAPGVYAWSEPGKQVLNFAVRLGATAPVDPSDNTFRSLLATLRRLLGDCITRMDRACLLLLDPKAAGDDRNLLDTSEAKAVLASMLPAGLAPVPKEPKADDSAALKLLNKCIDRMDNVRDLLNNGKTNSSNWNLLDTTDVKAALASMLDTTDVKVARSATPADLAVALEECRKVVESQRHICNMVQDPITGRQSRAAQNISGCLQKLWVNASDPAVRAEIVGLQSFVNTQLANTNCLFTDPMQSSAAFNILSHIDARIKALKALP